MKISKDQIKEIIEKRISESRLNNFAALGFDDEPMWDGPVIGFGRGDDPYFSFLIRHIGGFHWLPAEAFRLETGDIAVRAEDLCIVSIGFPQTRKTKELNAESSKEPTPRWTVSRGEWELFIKDLGKRIVDDIAEAGARAVVIDLIEGFQRETSEKYGAASTWSHRHAAFACGLGTFGLSGGLITRKGQAVRLATVLVECDIEADGRSYTDFDEWCGFRAGCRDCIDRCPVSAISDTGRDKNKCSDHLDYLKEKYANEGTLSPDGLSGCGLCQCGVACQDGPHTSAL